MACPCCRKRHPSIDALRLSTEALLARHLGQSALAKHTGQLGGVNNKIKVIKRMAYGYRDIDYFLLKIKAAFPGNARWTIKKACARLRTQTLMAGSLISMDQKCSAPSCIRLSAPASRAATWAWARGSRRLK